MLDLDLIPERYLRQVREFLGAAPDGHSLDHEIAQMMPEELVRIWLHSVGLPGYTHHIIGLVAAAYNAGRARDELWGERAALPPEARENESQPSSKNRLPAHKRQPD